MTLSPAEYGALCTALGAVVMIGCVLTHVAPLAMLCALIAAVTLAVCVAGWVG